MQHGKEKNSKGIDETAKQKRKDIKTAKLITSRLKISTHECALHSF